MNLVIDIGNSKTKLGLFQKNKLIQVYIISSQDPAYQKIKKTLYTIVQKHKIEAVLVSSVVKKAIPPALFKSFDLKVVNWKKTPLKTDYKTPKTLGKDRLALAVGAQHLFPKQNILVVSLGTCITYEYVSNSGTYLGGAISPGLNMRFKALHDYTGKLPLLKPHAHGLMPGKSTAESLQNGVFYGVLHDIEGQIAQFKAQYKSARIVLTGGDTIYFANELKNRIFAEPNLSLMGLNIILRANLSA